MCTKKELTKRYFVFLIGLLINSFGISFITRADLGTSPISSVPYVLSLEFTPTLGEFTIYLSLVLIALQICLLGRRFEKASLLQIPVSLLLGYFIDGAMALLRWMDTDLYWWKLFYLIVGCTILGFGVYIEVIADVVMMPGEAFVKAVVVRFGTDFGLTKVGMDVSMSVIAAVMSLLFFSRLTGVREGTAIAALLVGLMTKFYKKHFKRLETGLGLGQRDAVSESAETVCLQTGIARKQNAREDSKS